MTGYQSKKAAALDEEGMYLVHQTAQAKVEGPLHVVCQCDKCKAQPVQEPVAKVCHDLEGHIGWSPKLTELPPEGTELFTAAQPAQERNFCPRCGKRTNDIHTCTPPHA